MPSTHLYLSPEQPHHPRPPALIRVLSGTTGLILSLIPLAFLVWLSIPPAHADRIAGMGDLERSCLAWPPARRSGVVMSNRGNACAAVTATADRSASDEPEDGPATVELAGP